MYCNLFSCMLCKNVRYNKKVGVGGGHLGLGYRSSSSLPLWSGDSAPSFLSALTESHESALHVALLPSSSHRLSERKPRTEKATEMEREGRGCRTYRREHRKLSEQKIAAGGWRRWRCTAEERGSQEKQEEWEWHTKSGKRPPLSAW